MIKETLTFTDYDGNERTEDFYFNLSKAEVIEMEMSTAGGVERMVKNIIAEKDGKRIVEIFKEIIGKAYGKKSADGRKFIKSPELTEDFMQTEAYSDLFLRLASDADYAAKFIRGILPEIKEEEETPKASDAVVTIK